MSLAFAGLASFALSYAGLSGLCLGMHRHHRQVLQRSGSTATLRALRASGWILLALSLMACVRGWGAATGIVMWLGLLSASSMLIVLLLPYAPRVFARCAAAAIPVGVLSMAGMF
jgi:hypothetical protein